jgi:hypothetical protein
MQDIQQDIQLSRCIPLFYSGQRVTFLIYTFDLSVSATKLQKVAPPKPGRGRNVSIYRPRATTLHPGIAPNKIITVQVKSCSVLLYLELSRNMIFFYFAKYEITTKLILISLNSSKNFVVLSFAKFRLNYFAKFFR